MAKVQSMSVKDFMNGKEWTSKKDFKPFSKANLAGLASGAVGMTHILSKGVTAHAQTTTTLAPVFAPISHPIVGGVIAGVAVTKITTAFMPLLDLLQALAFPVTTIIITGACFLYMINMKDKATSLMINGIVGYFLIQLCPIFMQVLAEIAKAM